MAGNDLVSEPRALFHGALRNGRPRAKPATIETDERAPQKAGPAKTAPSGDRRQNRRATSLRWRPMRAPAADPADPSQTRKIAPNEVFRDPRAEALVDMRS